MFPIHMGFNCERASLFSKIPGGSILPPRPLTSRERNGGMKNLDCIRGKETP